MKKISLSLIALACALIIPFSSAGASSGWDHVGDRYLQSSAKYNDYRTNNVYSTGGNFQVRSPWRNAGDRVMIQLWEYDPGHTGSGKDDFVGARYLNTGERATFYNIGKYVDGSNGKAEFFVIVEDEDADIENYFFKLDFYD